MAQMVPVKGFNAGLAHRAFSPASQNSLLRLQLLPALLRLCTGALEDYPSLAVWRGRDDASIDCRQ
ncbi:hypothetical protein N7466_007195 [Penicillium verhagenii]|uniref:uncharacterized protein n=1 Tax=Penicillium verhagenii TaxID=1562060 RepID=UPI0025455362|nr:uncharacterized protein N7466_007195 [Penicillium verhagenii]KAJ5928239.1 hypothetical protein N7466_007195 [Penicillium verhagenii]